MIKTFRKGVFFLCMKYSQEITEEICKYLRAGNSQKDSAILSGITEETFYDWQRPESDQYHPEFSESLKKAELECKARNIALIQKAAEKSWQAAAWSLERKYNNEYALKQINELYGKDGEPIKLNLIGGADISEYIKSNASSTTSSAGGQTQVQSISVAQESKENNNSDITTGKVEPV